MESLLHSTRHSYNHGRRILYGIINKNTITLILLSEPEMEGGGSTKYNPPIQVKDFFSWYGMMMATQRTI